jgi:hypothetical protein
LIAAPFDLREAPGIALRCGNKGGLRRLVKPWKASLMIGLLCISGNPAALQFGGNELTYAIAAVLLAGVLLLGRKTWAPRAAVAFVPISAVFIALSIIHAYAFDFLPVVTLVGFLTRLFVGMAIVIIIPDFARTYALSMVGLSLLSFIFWVPEYVGLRFGIQFHNIFRTLASLLGLQGEDRWGLGFHTYMTIESEVGRNCGIFWEPGAFAGYIVLAILMLAATRDSLTWRQHWTGLGILSFALASTTSTTGYIAYPIAFLMNFNWRSGNRLQHLQSAIRTWVIVPLIVLGSWYSYNNFAFLEAKIRSQIKAVERREYLWEINRFGTFIFDWEYISRRPFTGWGIHKKTRYALHPWITDFRFGNGMTDFIAKFGFIGFGTFLLGICCGAYHIGNKSVWYVIGLVASVLILLQGEPYLGFPLFLGLMFLPHVSIKHIGLQRLRFSR